MMSAPRADHTFGPACARLKQLEVARELGTARTRGPALARVLRWQRPRMDLDMLVQRVQADFREFPGMQLTAKQAQRLWAVDDYLLDVLVHRGVLRRHSNGTISHTRAGVHFNNG